MRPGLNGLDLNALGIGARVSSYLAGEVLAPDVPAKDVTVEWTREREVPTRVTFAVPRSWAPETPRDPLANFGQRVHVEAAVESAGVTDRVTMGEFLIISWEEDEEYVKVEALDLMQVLAENPMAFPSSPPPGATLRSELRRLCEGLPVVLDCPDRPVPRDVQFGFDRVEAVADLCKSLNVEYAVKPDGCLHVFEVDEYSPVAVYTSRDVLVDAFRKSPERRANRVLVVGADNTGAHAAVENDAPPFDAAHYGWVTRREENDAVTTTPDAKKAAINLAKNIGRVTRSRTVHIMADPRIEGGDVIGVDTGAEIIVGKVAAYSINLSDPLALMRVDIEVDEW